MARAPRPDPETIRAALHTVTDPEIGRPITDLGMVGELKVDRSGTVTVHLLLTTAACPMRARIESDVRAAVTGVPGVTAVRLGVGTMPESQRMTLSRQLRTDGRRLGGAARVYAVASGKGGVGKSTVSANLAAALAVGGQRVGLVDADVWGYSIPQLFGVRRAPVAMNGLMLPVEAHGVRLMSVGFFVDDNRPVIWRGPMLHKALEQFLGDVLWGELDVLIVDLPPGTGDIQLSLLELLPEVQLLVVTSPQPAAEQVAARVGQMAADLRISVAGVIENMTALVCGGCGERTDLFGSGGGRRLADALGVSLLGQVPLDPALREAGDSGIPVVLAAPHAPGAAELRRIASSLPTLRRSLVGVPLPLSVGRPAS